MNSILPVLALLSSAAVAFAGSDELAYQSSSNAGWYFGGSVGHLSDRDDTLYTLHLGANLFRSGSLTHSLLAEVGCGENHNRQDEPQFVPITLDYKLDYQVEGRFSLYAGLGAGVAWIDEAPYGFATNRQDGSFEFMAQAFAGIGYEVCSNFQLYAGDRYIWVDESDQPLKSVSTGDDLVMELGARFRF